MSAAPVRMRMVFLGRAALLFEAARDAQIAITPIGSKTELSLTVHGLFTRALCWATSLYRLDDLVSDFQAHSVGARSMFELLVDAYEKRGAAADSDGGAT